jgi:hypothetical protein
MTRLSIMKAPSTMKIMNSRAMALQWCSKQRGGHQGTYWKCAKGESHLNNSSMKGGFTLGHAVADARLTAIIVNLTIAVPQCGLAPPV